MLNDVTKKFVEEAKELKSAAMKSMFDPDMLESIDVEELIFMKRAMSMFDILIQILQERADVMDDMNRKLDLLLEKN